MRIRNVKNKKEIIKKSKLFISDPEKYCGNWNKVFKNNKPIYIEIGMGKGNFIIESAKRNKNINYIGIEKEDSILSRALEKIDEIKNLRFIMYDAEKIDNLFNREIDRIYLNFSDPWPKTRHEKRRLTSLKFLSKYDKIFRKNNEIFLKTDNKDFFAYSVESLANFGYNFKNLTLNLESSYENIETEYEAKFRSKGILINRFEAYKNNSGKTLAIIGAMKDEISYLIDRYKLEKENDLFDIYYGKLNDKNIIVSVSGVGKVNSSIITQHIIDKYNPDMIINTGVAGSIHSNIKKMDVVVASLLTYHDFDPIWVMKKYVGINGVIIQDKNLVDKIVKILKDANIECSKVSICSGDQLVLDRSVKRKINKSTNCEVLDMESASIGHVCFKNNVKSLILRIISDDMKDDKYNEKEACEKLSEVIVKIVDSL